MRYYMKHATGILTEYNQHNNNDSWYRVGQGAGDACLCWIVQANSMILAYKQISCHTMDPICPKSCNAIHTAHQCIHQQHQYHQHYTKTPTVPQPYTYPPMEFGYLAQPPPGKQWYAQSSKMCMALLPLEIFTKWECKHINTTSKHATNTDHTLGPTTIPNQMPITKWSPPISLDLSHDRWKLQTRT